MKYNRITGIILAAGYSSRMGRLKALLPWQGKPLIHYQIEQMQQAGVGNIIVVLGHQKEKIKQVLASFPVQTVYNEDYAFGKSSSIRKGTDLALKQQQAIFISAVDQPVKKQTLQKMIQHIERTSAKVVIPVYHERRGHPILVAGTLKKELLAIKEETQGLRALTKKYKNDIAYLPVYDPTILLNFNRPNDYRKNRLLGGF